MAYTANEIKTITSKLKSWFSDDLKAPSKFHINFEMIYSWMHYSRKDVAKRALDNVCVENTDYQSTFVKNEDATGKKTKPTEIINLNISGLEKYAKSVPKSKGKEFYDLLIKTKEKITDESPTRKVKRKYTKKNPITINISNVIQNKEPDIQPISEIKNEEILDKESIIGPIVEIKTEEIQNKESDVESVVETKKEDLLEPIKLENNEIIKQIDTYMNTWLEMDFKEPGGKHVDFDPIWKGAGYTQKIHAKKALEIQFLLNDDYSRTCENNHKRGKPKEIIKLTINTAKEFCMMAKTSNGKLIRRYFIDQENKFRLLKQNLNSGRIQLKDTKTGEIYQPINIVQMKENERIQTHALCMEDHITSFYMQNCNYIGSIGKQFECDQSNQNADGITEETEYFKFGESQDIQKRFSSHIKTYKSFKPLKILVCYNREKAEKEFKDKMKELKLLRTLKINESEKEEILVTNEKYSIQNIINMLVEIVNRHNIVKEKENLELKHQLELKEKELEIHQLKAQLEIQNLKHQLEIEKLNKR